MASCKDIMCQEGITNKKEAMAWLLKHHPDRGGEPTSVNVGSFGACMGKKEFCQAKPASEKKATPEKAAAAAAAETGVAEDSGEKSSIGRVFQRVRVSAARDAASAPVEPAYKPNLRQLECVRQVSNWSKIGPAQRFNKSRFSIEDTDKLIPIASPKLEAMLQNIEALDKNDLAISGHTFKHFIFSDIKFLGYGAKIIASGFIARGFKPILRLDKSRIVVDVPASSGKNFAVLSSTALWDSPFKHKLKKEILDVYNARPDNIYGEKCRFIILDSGFKEGIDLFDVKYVHLFEPLMTAADMTQALGRATRLCGQKGLEFIPNRGWPLFVYKYSQTIPQALQPNFKATALFDIALQLKGLDTRLHRVTKAINDVSILAAVDQPLTEEIHKSGLLPKLRIGKKTEFVRTVETMAMSADVTRANLLGNKGRSALALEDEKLLARENEERLLLEDDPCAPRVPKECIGTIVPFQASRMSPATVIPTIVTEASTLVYTAPTTPAAIPKGIPTTWFELRRYVLAKFKKMSWDKQEIVNKCGQAGGAVQTRAQLAALAAAKAKKAAKTRKAAAAAVPVVAKKKGTKKAAVVAKKKGTKKAAVVAKKKAAVPVVEEPAPFVEKKKKGPALKLIDYTPTQDFISSYFTIQSPIKGMLLWHSVGTGKTCTAIALASRQFEPAGYTVMWVTRHTLKADIWKNVFDQVCHATIAEEVREGRLLPEDVEKRQRSLYQQWIPPISYRQFSNIVQGKNPIFKVLEKRNGKADPLKKTLIIIDEAHKLYSSDFKGAEKPDVGAFYAALQNSYKTSGKDSARVVLMSATPYNESPMELMSLLNLCREKEKALPEEFGAFIEKYMDSEGNFTTEGLKAYMNDVAGQISYLNREADPSQFAQPIYANVEVPISTIDSVLEGDNTDILDLRKEAADLLEEQRVLRDETIPYLEHQIGLIQPAMEAKLGECKTQFVGKAKNTKACQVRVTKRYKEALKLEERNLREARKRAEKISSEYEKTGKKIVRITVKARKSGLGMLTQQAQLEDRCKIGI